MISLSLRVAVVNFQKKILLDFKLNIGALAIDLLLIWYDIAIAGQVESE